MNNDQEYISALKHIIEVQTELINNLKEQISSLKLGLNKPNYPFGTPIGVPLTQPYTIPNQPFITTPTPNEPIAPIGPWYGPLIISQGPATGNNTLALNQDEQSGVIKFTNTTPFSHTPNATLSGDIQALDSSIASCPFVSTIKTTMHADSPFELIEH